ncbi:MAG: hypothetical protein ACT4O9_00470 [Blastocatellia bacterium]
MRRFQIAVSAFVLIGLVFSGFAFEANAQRRNDREMRDVVRSLNSKIEDVQYKLGYQLRSSSADRQEIANVTADLRELQTKARAFEDNLNQRRENRDDVNEILAAAMPINEYLSSGKANRQIEDDWSGVRELMERLAANYGVTPDWEGGSNDFPTNNTPAPVRAGTALNAGLTGTYRLDASRSESTADILANSNVGASQKQDLETKLEAPEQVAIDIRGNQVSLASTKASPITFVADGREKTEQSGGRTVRVRATLRGEQLTVSSIGGETDYTVTFQSMDNGRSMKVTRRITTDYLRETIFAESIYNKTDATAQLGIDGGSNDSGAYSSNDPNDRAGANSPNPTLSQPRIGEFLVPNGTVVTGILENEINTKASQNNDRFKLTVQTPAEYRGAVIEGYISGVGRSGQVSGRSNVTFNFERITLRNGKVYDFAGVLQGVTDQNGKTVKVDTEGTAKGDSQTKETAKRGGLGAGAGAILGAIIGGAKGAVIGAVIGGGAGAGSVIATGRDDVRLMPGSTVTVQSSSPVRQQAQTREN